MAVACSSLQTSVGQSDAFEDFRSLSSYPLDQVGSGEFFSGEDLWLAEKGYFAQRHILFIVSAAAVRLTSGRMLPFSSHVYIFWMKS